MKYKKGDKLQPVEGGSIEVVEKVISESTGAAGFGKVVNKYVMKSGKKYVQEDIEGKAWRKVMDSKKFVVDTGTKKYVVCASNYDEAIKAVELVQLKDETSLLQKDLAHAMQFADSKVKDDIDAVRIIGIRYNKYVVMDKTATKVLSPKFDDVDDAYNWIKKNYPRAKVLDSKIKDEANLPTTIQALVNDEEAAIKAYEVAIKNLEGKIDETQMQVLINIMKDERRHVENLYAILNGQVTEKNLEDSKVRDDVEDKVDDILDRLNIDYNGDVYSGIELKKGSREERLFLNELNKAHIRYTKSEDTHSGRGYVGYYDFR